MTTELQHVPGGPTTPPAPTTTARAVLPKVVTDRATATSTARVLAGRATHATGFHTARAGLYGLRILARVPLGLWRVLAFTWRWVVDAEHHDAYRDAIRGKADPNAYRNLRADHREQTKRRALAVVIVAAVLTLGALHVIHTGEPLVQAAAVAGVLITLGLIGRRDGQQIIDHAVDTAEVPPLTAELITTALSTIGLATINAALREDPRAVRYQSIVRDGPGYRADIDLPGGATAGEVINQRSKLASGLRRPLGCVWPEADADVHEGRLVLYVADKSLSESKPRPWPLAKNGKVNIFQPFPLGADQRGRTVEVNLMYASGLVGAVPRMGKTFTLRLLLLAASLDPRVELHAYNLKGGSDLDPLEAVAHSYRTGDDPEDMEYMLGDVRALQAEMRRRYKAIRALPKDLCPESKVTDALASDRQLGLHPIILAFDETQVMFEHGEHGKEYIETVTDLVKRGPAVGIMVWLATQRPDAKSIPTGISANAVLRLCLKVMGQVENDMVLGTSQYKAGVRATMFGRKDLGVAYLVGEGDDPVIVRTSYVDAPTAEKIAARARAAREAAGRLSGLAAGDEPADLDKSTILDHLADVWPVGEDKLWCDELARRLAEARPHLYAGWTGEQVTRAVTPHGVRSRQVALGTGAARSNRRGLHREDLVLALTE